jgi:integrase
MTLLVMLCRRRSRRQQGGAENGLAWVPDPSQKTQNPRSLKDLKKRGHHTAPRDHVFVNRDGGALDGSALRRRYIRTLDAAGLRRLTFHDLRHTFGSHAINGASIVQVQAWMGHADIKTTQRYLHHKSRADDARLLSAAFQSARRNAA